MKLGHEARDRRSLARCGALRESVLRLVKTVCRMLDGHNIKHKGLRRLWVDNDRSRVPAQWVDKIGRILQALNAATSPEELYGVPGYGLHPLKGNREGTWSTAVSRN